MLVSDGTSFGLCVIQLQLVENYKKKNGLNTQTVKAHLKGTVKS